MKVLKSDMKRTTLDRNSVKDTSNITEAFKEHRKMVMRDHSNLFEEGSKVPKNI